MGITLPGLSKKKSKNLKKRKQKIQKKRPKSAKNNQKKFKIQKNRKEKVQKSKKREAPFLERQPLISDPIGKNSISGVKNPLQKKFRSQRENSISGVKNPYFRSLISVPLLPSPSVPFWGLVNTVLWIQTE
jgi:hypothetical protein